MSGITAISTAGDVMQGSRRVWLALMSTTSTRPRKSSSFKPYPHGPSTPSVDPWPLSASSCSQHPASGWSGHRGGARRATGYGPGTCWSGSIACSCGRHLTWPCECGAVSYGPALAEGCSLVDGPARLSIRWCWSSRIPSWRPGARITASGCGRWPRWPPMPLGGGPSTGRVCPCCHRSSPDTTRRLGDALNAGVPGQDHASYGDLVANQIAGVVRAYGTPEDPDA